MRGAAAVRAAEVRALLAGTGTVDAAAVSLRLGYELDRIHVGFVVWSEEAGERPGDAGGPVRGDGAGGGRGRRVARRGGAADRRRGQAPRLLGGAAERAGAVAPAPPPRRAARPLGRRRDAGARGRGLRPEPPRGALGAPRLPSCAAIGDGAVATYPDLALEALLAERPRCRPPLRRPRARPARRRGRRNGPSRLDRGDLPRGGLQLRPRRPPPRHPRQHRRLPRPPRRIPARPADRRSGSWSCASPCASAACWTGAARTRRSGRPRTGRGGRPSRAA